MTSLRIGLVFLLGVIVLVLAVDKLRQPARDQDTARQLAELRQAQDELRALEQAAREREARLGLQALARERAAAAAPSKAAVPIETAPATGAAAPAPRAPLTEEDVEAAMENRFAAQPQDADWSPRAEQRVLNRIQRGAGESAALEGVRCSAAMCRIETSHQDLDAYHRFVEETFIQRQTALWNGGFFSKVIDTAPDGRVTVVTFLAREQQQLPDISRL